MKPQTTPAFHLMATALFQGAAQWKNEAGLLALSPKQRPLSPSGRRIAARRILLLPLARSRMAFWQRLRLLSKEPAKRGTFSMSIRFFIQRSAFCPHGQPTLFVPGIKSAFKRKGCRYCAALFFLSGRQRFLYGSAGKKPKAGCHRDFFFGVFISVVSAG